MSYIIYYLLIAVWSLLCMFCCQVICSGNPVFQAVGSSPTVNLIGHCEQIAIIMNALKCRTLAKKMLL